MKEPFGLFASKSLSMRICECFIFSMISNCSLEKIVGIRIKNINKITNAKKALSQALRNILRKIIFGVGSGHIIRYFFEQYTS